MATLDGCVTDSKLSPNDRLVEFKDPYGYSNFSVSNAITANNSQAKQPSKFAYKIGFCTPRILQQSKRTWSYVGFFLQEPAGLCRNPASISCKSSRFFFLASNLAGRYSCKNFLWTVLQELYGQTCKKS